MDFDLSDDHELLRRTVRDFAEQRGRAGRGGARPRRSASRTRSSAKLGELGLMGIPFPEEVRRRRAATRSPTRSRSRSSRASTRRVAITMCAHTSLGTQPIYLFGSEEQKQRLAARPVRRPQARRLRPDRARGGLGRRQRPHARDARRRRLGRSTAPSSSSPTRAPTSPATSRSRRGPATDEISNLIVENGTPGLRAGRAVPQDGLERVGHAAADLHGLPRARGEPARPARATASSSSCTSSTSAASASRRWASASRRARSTRRSPTRRSARRSASRSPSSRRSRPSSPTWRPRSRRRGCSTYKAALLKDAGPQLHAHRRAGEAQDRPPRGARDRGGRADPRRLRLHRGVPGLPLLPRREDPHDRRGHRRGPADGDRAGARR